MGERLVRNGELPLCQSNQMIWRESIVKSDKEAREPLTAASTCTSPARVIYFVQALGGLRVAETAKGPHKPLLTRSEGQGIPLPFALVHAHKTAHLAGLIVGRHRGGQPFHFRHLSLKVAVRREELPIHLDEEKVRPLVVVPRRETRQAMKARIGGILARLWRVLAASPSLFGRDTV